MKHNPETNTSQYKFTGLGLILGAAAGVAIGGNWLGICLALGLVNGMIADALGRIPLYTLGGLATGALAGLLLELALRQSGMAGFSGLGPAAGLALGQVGGALLDQRKNRRENQN